MKSLFLIAAYNESNIIQTVVENLLKKGEQVLVINDGSSDSTGQILKKFGHKIFYCEHLVNLGQGAALQTGILCARKLQPQYLITFDADGQHQSEDALSMVESMDKNPQIDITLGSRFLGKAENISQSRLFTLKMAVLFTNIFSGIKLTDTHNGLRVMRKSFYQNFNFHHSGMEHASEILDYIALKNISFQEFPVHIKYSEYSKSKGQSGHNSIKMALRLLGDKFL